MGQVKGQSTQAQWRVPVSLVDGQSDVGKILAFAWANRLRLPDATQHAYGHRQKVVPPFLAVTQSLLRVRQGECVGLPKTLSSHRFRYCPVCAEYGYLPSAFMFAWMTTCPAHGVSLLSACMSCGVELDHKDLLRGRAYICNLCHQPWCGAEPQEDADAVRSASTIILNEWNRISAAWGHLGRGLDELFYYFGERVWILAASVLKIQPSPQWKVFSPSIGKYRKFPVRFCNRSFRTPELTPKLERVIYRLEQDLYDELSATTRREIEWILDYDYGFARPLPEQRKIDPLALGIAAWRSNLRTICEKQLLFRQDGPMHGVPTFGGDTFVAERSWRTALLASLYAYCEAAKSKRCEEQLLFDRNAVNIVLPCIDGSFYAWAGSFPPLDRVPVTPECRPRSAHHMEEVQRLSQRRHARYMSCIPDLMSFSKPVEPEPKAPSGARNRVLQPRLVPSLHNRTLDFVSLGDARRFY